MKTKTFKQMLSLISKQPSANIVIHDRMATIQVGNQSVYVADNDFDYQKLLAHKDCNIVIAVYNSQCISNISIECEDCYEVLCDWDRVN